MRISDWSSDVCSSDLHVHDPRPGPDMRPVTISEAQYALLARRIDAYFALDPYGAPRPIKGYGASDVFYRSEEHTSELQSLMRISYAVFCLKKKTIQEKQIIEIKRQITL